MAKIFTLGERGEELFVGDDLIIRIQLVKRDSTGKEVVEGDVSGNAYAFDFKKSPDDAAVLFTITTVGGGITFDAGDTAGFPPELAGANTVAVVAIADTDTDALAEGIYHGALKRTDDGAEVVVAYGTITLTKGVA